MRIDKRTPFCPNCKYENPLFLLNPVSNKKHGDIQYGTRTKFEWLLASALKKERIEFRANPLIRLCACDKYNPDFLIRRRLIVEVDGGIHDRDYRKTPDRIRQRALEKLGYTVYRVRNETVKSSPQKVAKEVLQQYFEVADVEKDQAGSFLSKAKSIENLIPSGPSNARLSSVANKLKDCAVKWNYENFRTCLSGIDYEFLTNPCFTERLIFELFGLDLTINDTGKLSFKKLSDFFKNGINIMSKLYGDLAKIYLINGFSVTAPGFMKNLVFHGGPPSLNRKVVTINSIESLEDHISEFNNYFSGIGVKLERDEVKTECVHELGKLDSVSKEKYLWLLKWIKQDSTKSTS
jgi:very-short-patch-repair endonuclease